MNIDQDIAITGIIAGIGGTLLGTGLGYLLEGVRNKKSERKQTKQLLIDLKGKAEGIMLLIIASARTMAEDQYVLYHFAWQNESELTLPDENKVETEFTVKEFRNKIHIDYKEFQNLVSQLRTCCSVFSSISENINKTELYLKIQFYDVAAYEYISHYSTEKYLQHPYSAAGVNAARNKADKILGEQLAKLTTEMEDEIKNIKI